MSELLLFQLAQQAQLYDLATMMGRKYSTEKVEEFFLELHSLLPITSCFEIGAHEANFSHKIKALLPHAQVQAFEANPAVYAHFLLKGYGQKNFDYINTAISNVDGTVQFQLCDSIGGQEEDFASRRQSMLKRIENTNEGTFVWVPSKTLDTLTALSAKESLHSMWIDAEGATGLILEGAKATLEKTALIYVEMESVPKFEKQWTEKTVMAFLLEAGFLPLVRDFQFRHQYNTVFIKKDLLTQIENVWHNYLGKAQRRTFAKHFSLVGDSGKHIPVAPKPLEKIQYAHVGELKEAMELIPLLRAPKVGLDPSKIVVACHAAHVDEAVDYYKKTLKKLPEFYVLGDYSRTNSGQSSSVTLKDFSCIDRSRQIQLYFTPSTSPSVSHFPQLDKAVRIAGFPNYFIEKHCTDTFYRRNRKEMLSDAQWHTVLDFTNILADAESQYSYMAVIKSLLHGEPGFNPIAGYAQYFHPKVSVAPRDILCEGGIDDGLSTLRFLEKMNNQGKIYAFEAFEDNWPHLEQAFKTHEERIILEKNALWSENGSIKIFGVSPSAACQREDGSLECPCVNIDSYFQDKAAPTCIKLDVEGAEKKVLEGAKKTLNENLPKLLLSIYHIRNQQDYVVLPQMLMDMHLDYEYYVGHHRPWYNETILYAKKKG